MKFYVPVTYVFVCLLSKTLSKDTHKLLYMPPARILSQAFVISFYWTLNLFKFCFACKVPIKCYYSKMKTIRLRPANIFVINYPFRQSPVLSLFSLNSLFVFVWAFFSSSILFRILFGCHLFCVYKLLQGY